MTNRPFRSPRQLLMSFVRPYWKLLILTLFLLLAETVLSTVQPLVMAPMVKVALDQSNIFATDGTGLALVDVNLNNVDTYVSQLLGLGQMNVWTVVLFLSGAFLGVVIVKAVVETAGFYLFTMIRVRSLRNLQEYVFGHLVTLSLDYFNARRSGEVVSRIEQETGSAVNSLISIIRSLATAPLMILFYGYLLIRTNLTLMLLVSVIALLQWGMARLLRDRLRALVRDEFDLIANLKAYLHEIFQNIRVVKSFAAEDFERQALSKKVESMIPVHINRALFRHWQIPITSIVNGVANVSILMLSARELFSGGLTVTGFFLFLYLGRSIIQPISELGSVYLNLQEMEAATERVFEIVQQQTTVTDGSVRKADFTEAIHINGVGFAYGDIEVLHDVSIEIKQGEMVALVGPSGAGKSTLTDLLMRFYDPTSGQVTIDGVDLRDLQIEPYRRLFGVVAQENLLFNATIADNIAYGRDGILWEDIRSAAEIANAAEFIEETGEGYETFVGDRGIRLSGGQRQRVAIARAMVHHPQILIMDEATSSLDTASERLVQAAIDRVIQGTTAIVVAHRLSTVIHADKIVVLEAGKVVDQGTHNQLLERCKLYRRLCELQFQINDTEDSVVEGQVLGNSK
ncbi:MAG: ABC transporter ATP-binding protein [Chloroflexi bacterium]|nr:ABC transporter ATP-binding protein [Chloroflexota bacterium]